MTPPEADSPSSAITHPFRFEGLSAFGVFVVCVLLLVPGIGDYGVTWDEASPNFPAARKQVTWLQRFLSTGEGLNEAGVREGFETESDHPSLPRTLMALSRLALGEGVSDRVAFALPVSIIVSVFIAVFFLVAKRLWGWIAGLGGTAILLLHPRWFAHSHLAEYDVPIAVAWWFAAMSFYWANDSRPRAGTGWERAAIAALLTGLALSVKLHAFFLPFPFLIWALAFRRWGAWKWAVASVVACPMLYLGTQPYLWWHTVERLSGRFLDYSEKLPIRVYYLGEVYGGNLPWHYPWFMLLATLPAGFFFFALLGGFRLFSPDCEPHTTEESNCSARKGFGGIQTRRIVFLILNAVTTPLIFTWKSPYDGIRLFLAAVPFLAMLAAEGIAFLQSLASKRWGSGFRWLVPALVLAAVVGQAYTCFRLHPFQLAHYSSLVGGIRGANRLGLETTYWCDGITPPFLKDLSTRLPEEANISTHALDSTPLEEYQMQGVVPESWRFDEPGSVHARIVQFRQGFFGPGEWALVTSGNRPLLENAIDGVPLVRVYKGP